MKGSLRALRAGIAALGLWALASPAGAALDYQDYHSFAEVDRQLQDWSREHSKEMQLLTIGRSAGGRPLYVARIAAPGGPEADSRPAVFVGANIAGYHNAGTEAALDLIRTLLTAPADGTAAKLLASRTFYIAPALNPDAHDGLFGKPRVRRSGNAMKVDHDVDGLEGEDPADDLDGDGVITRLRFSDPTGGWLADATDPRVLVKADAMEQLSGAFRVVTEGRDDDGDGESNEDGTDGLWPDQGFPHAFPYSTPTAGPWSSYAPETKALLDFLLGRRNVALAVVYGPANNLLAAPQSLGGGGGDLGSQKFKVPTQAAQFMGLDPEKEYTIDEIWEVAQNHPFVRQNNVTKDQLQQFLGAGAANKVDADDQAWFDKLAEGYKERLKKAGLSADRPGAQYGKGGLTPWLYYQAGAVALELDVWGVPKAEAPKADAGAEALTFDKVAGMTSEELIAQGEEKITAFLKDNKVPARFNAGMVLDYLKGGQIDPKGLVERMKQMGSGGGSGGGGGKPGAAGAREREVMAWVEANAPGGFTPWSPVTLPDGTKAEAGGLDPFVELNPPTAFLKPALTAHTETVLDLAGKLARVEILSVDVKELSGGVYRVTAVAGNRGVLATHSKQAERAKARRPVRLTLKTGDGVELVTGYPFVVTERLEGTTGTLEGEWLVQARPGTKIVIDLTTENAGRDQKTVTIGPKGA